MPSSPTRRDVAKGKVKSLMSLRRNERKQEEECLALKDKKSWKTEKMKYLIFRYDL